MVRLLRDGQDQRLAVVLANGLDPTLIPRSSCEVSRNQIRYREIARDALGVTLVDDDGCPLLSDWITIHRSDAIAGRWYQS